MKKILMSVMVIGIATAFLGAGTFAYFTDTEISTGNTFTAGTIDIDIDGQNPWTGSFTFDDIKPCRVEYITFTINNVGNNPVNVFKHIKNVECTDGDTTYSDASSESEYTDCGGEFDVNGNPTGQGYVAKNNIHKWIIYDMSVKVYARTGGLLWWQVIYDEDSDLTVKDITCFYVQLGMIPVGGYMVVTQSYHMKAETGNWAQGDTMTFDIEVYGEQLNGPEQMGLQLVPKMEEGGEWHIDWTSYNAGTKGQLEYNIKGSAFDYDFTGTAPLANTDYCLIYYADPYKGNNPGALIDCGTTDASGGITLIGSIDLGMDLPHADDANYPGGAKIWLVTSADYNSDAKTTGPMTGWNPDNYLFELGYIVYDDIDV